jgi:hypothetical protein
MSNHICKLLDTKKHELSVKILRAEVSKDKFEEQWFLVNEHRRTAESIIYCPYCGIKLDNKVSE